MCVYIYIYIYTYTYIYIYTPLKTAVYPFGPHARSSRHHSGAPPTDRCAIYHIT